MNIFALASATSGAPEAPTGLAGFLANYSGFIIIIVFFLIMYFFIVRPQKKKEKETTEMRNALEVGDEIVTIGGIVGRVVNVKDDTVIIETGGDKNKLTFLKSAISSKTKSE